MSGIQVLLMKYHKELEIMYNASSQKSYLNSGCNVTLSNRRYLQYKLHVIYYNFPEDLHRSGTKINKTCCDKLTSL